MSTYNASNSTDLMEIQWKSPWLGVVLILFCVITVFGNMLVICSIKRERHLKSTSNYYIASLAVADLIVGFVVMPTATLFDMSNNVWFLGQAFCDIWHSMDVFASTASILSLLVIALDRYAAISDPINYQNKWLTRNWPIYITGIWICSAFISFPAIAYWRLGTTKNAYSSSKNTGHLMYLCEFTDDVVYLVFSSLVSFYIPLPAMIFIYIRIYRTATRQMQFHLAGQKAFMKSSDGAELALRIHRGRYNSLMPNADAELAGMVTVQTKPDILQQRSNCKQDQSNPNRVQLLAKFKPIKTLRKFSHDQKAATTLGILMGVFMCCWLPFFVYNVMTGIFKTESRAYLHAIFTWLGYINSGCNPIIYAFSSRDFRKSFHKILFPGDYMRRRLKKTVHGRSSTTSDLSRRRQSKSTI